MPTNSKDETSSGPRILFVSRAYPPVTGGIENQNYELSVWLPKLTPTTTLANRKGKKFLPVFLPYALVRSLWLMRTHDVLLLGDGVLAAVGWFAKKLFPEKKVVSIVHGLDLTYASVPYQELWVRRFLPALDLFIAVGNETVRVGIEKGLPRERFAFIPNGVDTTKCSRPGTTRQDIENVLGEPLGNRKTVLTSGRLARRKGVAWFIRNVMPKLPENVLYVVAGDGADRDNVAKAVAETGLEGRVRLLGFVSDGTRNILLNGCDLFVQPNIRIEGDMEGFGISVIEAAAAGRVVVASRLEGLKDAIIEGENGFLVEPEDADGYAAKIVALLADDSGREAAGERAHRFVSERFGWGHIARQYLEAIRRTVCKEKGADRAAETHIHA
jgi:glycosyltransferase involved in cell wall biosynthesis